MDLTQFTTQTTKVSKPFKYSILIVPNASHEIPSKDANFRVIQQTIRVMNSVRDDLQWNLLVPKGKDVKFLDVPNVRLIEYPYPDNKNLVKAEFSVEEIEKILTPKSVSYDIVYCQLPEVTCQWKNWFAQHSSDTPRFVGYCHWYELPGDNCSYDTTFMKHNLAGTLEMEECGVNTEWLKNLILEKAAEYISVKELERLKTILQPHYLGTDVDFSPSKNQRTKTILFNHRTADYTGTNRLLPLMDKIWEKRKDFKLVVTGEKNGERPYLEYVNLPNRADYIDLVKSVSFGIGLFKKYSAWSLSVTDGLGVGTPYILPNKLCYPEMLPAGYPLLYETDEQFLELVDKSLDNPNLKKECQPFLTGGNVQTWETVVPKWFNNWKILDPTTWKVIKNSDSIGRIEKFIKKKGTCTKREILKELGWGAQIKFGPYRNLLRLNPHVQFTVDGYEWI